MESLLPVVIRPYFPMIKSVALALVIFVIGAIVARVAARLVIKVVERRKMDLALGHFLAAIARYAVLAATFIAALGAVGIQTTSLVAIFASAGLAIGLALQGSLANFAAGVMILFFRPFDLGQVITSDGHTGKVEDIGLFSTTLLTASNEKVIIPNAKVTAGAIINLTAQGTRRGNVDVGVAYGADVKQVQTVLLAAAARVPTVLKDPAPGVAFVGLGASSIDFTVLAWAYAGDYGGMLSSLRQAVYEELNQAGIEIPFGQIVVHQAPNAG